MSLRRWQCGQTLVSILNAPSNIQSHHHHQPYLFVQGEQGDPGPKGFKGDPGDNGEDATGSSDLVVTCYTKWGADECPDGATAVYVGTAGASYANNAGAGSNLVCLHPMYSFDAFTAEYRSSTFGSIVGVEYRTTANDPLAAFNNLNVPCAVCAVQSDAVYMQPGKTTCPSGWAVEYTGYIMSEQEATVTGRAGERYRGEFVCVMNPPDVIANSASPTLEAQLNHVHVDCENPATEILDCADYTAPLACVVCSKE